jgi:hypothetical protein
MATDAIEVLYPSVTRGAIPVPSEAKLDIVARFTGSDVVTAAIIDGVPVPVGTNGQFRRRVDIRPGETEIALYVVDAHKRIYPRVISLEAPNAKSLLAKGQRYALLIGNADYRDDAHWPLLKTPFSDIIAVGKALEEQYGYKTEIEVAAGKPAMSLLLKDTSARDISKVLDRLSNKLVSEDTLVVFYAGHGTSDQASGTGYWVGVNAEWGVPADMFSNAQLNAALMKIAARNVLVLVDSCYAGAFIRGASEADVQGQELPTMREQSLLKALQKKKRIVIASGGEQPVLDGGGSGHSVFAQALLEGLAGIRKPIFSATDLFQFIHERVTNSADQDPQHGIMPRSGNEEGDFIFVRN